MKKNRTQVINELIEANGFESYLEIGLGEGYNFRGVKCERKLGIDPKISKLDFRRLCGDGVFGSITSDYFFENNTDTFDLIFIDGDHTAEQVERDIVNAWNCLNKGGVIVLHDIYPKTKESTNVPKTSSPWKGDVYKSFVGFIKKYPKINSYTTLDDTGLGFIWKSRHKVEADFIADISWEEFDKNRDELLRVK